MEKNWKILNLKRNSSDDLVTEITYECRVTIDNTMDREIGTVIIEGDINDPDFIAYDNLTEETIVGWLETKLTTEGKTTIEDALITKINEKISKRAARTTKQGLPWGK